MPTPNPWGASLEGAMLLCGCAEALHLFKLYPRLFPLLYAIARAITISLTACCQFETSRARRDETFPLTNVTRVLAHAFRSVGELQGDVRVRHRRPLARSRHTRWPCRLPRQRHLHRHCCSVVVPSIRSTSVMSSVHRQVHCHSSNETPTSERSRSRWSCGLVLIDTCWVSC